MWLNDMSVFSMIMLATFLAGLLSISLAALLAFRLSQTARSAMVAFAAGVMLSTACLDILPEAAEHFLEAREVNADFFASAEAGEQNISHEHRGEGAAEKTHGGGLYPLFVTLFVGILSFFILEHFALWRHAHTEEENEESSQGKEVARRVSSVVPLILVGDGFHNFVDGILIAASFLASPLLGITATFAIMAHEIPQELGDFIILLHGGLSRLKAFIANALSSLTAALGGVFGYFFMADAENSMPYILVIAAASFIYIALADLIPMLRHGEECAHGQDFLHTKAQNVILTGHKKQSRCFGKQFTFMFSGALIVPLFEFLTH
ncbi:MAG: ZIP family metal transporter [Zoogloeaceae bacterium]|jgi:zinc and cadmium transporter|nr:ZIP family metal transporter [Zoogloeaceae bacterium]